MDFVTHYEQLFPDVVAAKTKEAAAARARPTPVRKRTKPVDMRVSRSSIAAAGKEPPVPFHSEGAGEISNVKLPSLTTNVDKTSHAEDTSPTPIAERMLSDHPKPRRRRMTSLTSRRRRLPRRLRRQALQQAAHTARLQTKRARWPKQLAPRRPRGATMAPQRRRRCPTSPASAGNSAAATAAQALVHLVGPDRLAPAQVSRSR